MDVSSVRFRVFALVTFLNIILSYFVFFGLSTWYVPVVNHTVFFPLRPVPFFVFFRYFFLLHSCCPRCHPTLFVTVALKSKNELSSHFFFITDRNSWGHGNLRVGFSQSPFPVMAKHVPAETQKSADAGDFEGLHRGA